MSENVFRPSKKGKVINDAVAVFLNDSQILHGWENISVTKNLDAIAQGFSMDVTDKWRQTGDKWVLKPGAKVEIRVGEKQFLVGYIDSLSSNFDASTRTITVSGRSLAGDLIDCSTKDKSEFNNISLTALATQLISPFGLSVTASTDTGDKFNKFSVEQGDTIFDTIERAARLRGVIFISKDNGNLEIVRSGTENATTELHQGVNILSGSAQFNSSERFSEYVVKGQSQGTDNILIGKQASAPKGIATDAGVERFRPLVIVASGNVDDGKAKTRAEWESSVRAAKGATINIKVQGWRQENADFWQINKLTRVRAGHLGIDDTFLISGLQFQKSLNGGTTTQISLVRKDAYNPQPVIEKSKDPVSVLGPLNSTDKTGAGSTGLV